MSLDIMLIRSAVGTYEVMTTAVRRVSKSVALDALAEGGTGDIFFDLNLGKVDEEVAVLLLVLFDFLFYLSFRILDTN